MSRSSVSLSRGGSFLTTRSPLRGYDHGSAQPRQTSGSGQRRPSACGAHAAERGHDRREARLSRPLHPPRPRPPNPLPPPRPSHPAHQPGTAHPSPPPTPPPPLPPPPP